MPCLSCNVYFQHVWAWRNVIVFTVTPLILLPLILCYEDYPELKEPMRCAYVMAIMAVYWVTEAIPLGITSLVPMVLFPFLEVARSWELAPLYLDSTNMAIIASMLVVKAFEDAQLHKRFAFAVIKVVGVRPRWLLAGLMTLSWFLSMLLSNAMTATLIIPIVLEINHELRQAINATTAKRFSIPRVNVAPVITARMSTDEASPQPSKANRRYENMFVLGVAYSCSIGGIATLMGTPENLTIRDEIYRLYNSKGCDKYNPINFATWMIWGLPAALIFLPLSWLWILTYYMGPRYAFGLKAAPDNFTLREHQLLEVIQQIHLKLGPWSCRQWVVLGHIVVMVMLFLTRLLNTRPPIGWDVIAPGFMCESTVACLTAISLFVFPISLPKRKDGKKKLCRPKKAIKWTSKDGGEAFNIVLLIGGGRAASHVATDSGFSRLISNLLYKAIGSLDPHLNVVCLIIFSIFLTELISNAASVHFLLRILSQLTEKESRSPLLYLLPTVFTASFAFMLPVATQPNAVAFSLTKGLRVIDMIVVGFVMNLLGLGVTILATNTWGAIYFLLYSPAWMDGPKNDTYLCYSISDGQWVLGENIGEN